MMAADEEFYAKLEADGVAKVRANLATSVYSVRQKPFVIEWLERSNEATSSEQIELARRAVRAAETANIKATTAIVIAIISIITAIMIGVIPYLLSR